MALNAPKRLTEALRAGWLEGRAQMAHWYAMLLANVSTSKKGQDCDVGGVANGFCQTGGFSSASSMAGVLSTTVSNYHLLLVRLCNELV